MKESASKTAAEIASEPCCGPVEERLLLEPGGEADEELALRAKALGHPARVAIVRLLLQRERCVCGEIVSALPLAQSTVSQHLRVLRDAGWVQGEVEGPRTCYAIAAGAAERFRLLLDGLAEG